MSGFSSARIRTFRRTAVHVGRIVPLWLAPTASCTADVFLMATVFREVFSST
jgi:hypothetical protein